jgi:hypothetical protein
VEAGLVLVAAGFKARVFLVSRCASMVDSLVTHGRCSMKCT